jgi:shikimate kinase
VFLDVSQAEAARRIGEGPGREGRPLAASWERLLAARLPLYRRAHLTVPVDGRSPEAVARWILGAL